MNYWNLAAVLLGVAQLGILGYVLYKLKIVVTSLSSALKGASVARQAIRDAQAPYRL